MDYREELFKALTTGVEGAMRDKSIDALVEVCRVARKEGYNAGLEDGKKQKKSVFKVGDRVRTIREQDELGTPLFPVGTIGEVIEIDCDGDCLVEAYETGKARYYYLSDELELANDVIVVGDEVVDKNEWGVKGVVTEIGERCMSIVEKEGWVSRWKKDEFNKTGRRFPQIEEILKQMKD